MSQEEALLSIKVLKNKILHTKSKKMKRLYMLDILNLQEYLYSNFGILVDDEQIYVSQVFEKAIITIENEANEAFEEYIDLNPLTKRLSSQTLTKFDKAHFVQYFKKNTKLNTEFLEDRLEEFLRCFDDNVIDKYNEIVSGGVLINYSSSYGGICWDFYGLKKQVINISAYEADYNPYSSDILFYEILMHELGHAVYMNTANNISKNKSYVGALDESISLMFERMFLDFLERNGVNVDTELRNHYSFFLDETIMTKAGALAITDNNLEVDGSIPIKYLSKENFPNYPKVVKNLAEHASLDYETYIPYFYGNLIATKFLDEYKDDYKKATSELMKILIKKENTSAKELIKEIELNKYPTGIAKTLKKINK